MTPEVWRKSSLMMRAEVFFIALTCAFDASDRNDTALLANVFKGCDALHQSIPGEPQEKAKSLA